MRPMQNLIGGKLRPAMSGRTFDLVDPTTGTYQIRPFTSAARVLEGTSVGECMRGGTSMIRREPIGLRAGHALGHPDDDGDLGSEPGHRGGQYDRAQPGGFKRSGHGKDLSMYSLGDRAHIEHVMSDIEA